jgi:hypothetical protein
MTSSLIGNVFPHRWNLCFCSATVVPWLDVGQLDKAMPRHSRGRSMSPTVESIHLSRIPSCKSIRFILYCLSFEIQRPRFDSALNHIKNLRKRSGQAQRRRWSGITYFQKEETRHARRSAPTIRGVVPPRGLPAGQSLKSPRRRKKSASWRR